MENKLQELTNKLYEEGLAKGREQADAVIKQAKEEANAIVEKAKKEAVWMVERAEKEAADHKEQVENEIRMASRHTISTLKKKIESMVVLKALEIPTRKAVEDTTFIQGIIGQLAAAFNPEKLSQWTCPLYCLKNNRNNLLPLWNHRLLKFSVKILRYPFLPTWRTDLLSDRATAGIRSVLPIKTLWRYSINI